MNATRFDPDNGVMRGPCYEIARMRSPVVALVLVAFGVAVSVAMTACESSVNVGEPKTDAGTEPGPIVGPDPDAGDGSSSLIYSWRQHSPIVPCTIYGMDERASNDVFLGCNGGRIYRFDGVKARLDLEVDEAQIASLFWHAPGGGGGGGDEWAGVQSQYDGFKAKTQLHRFDGTKWTKFGEATRRYVALAGVTDLWVAGESELFRLEGNELVSKYTATNGFFRGCSFAAPDKGWCVGTNGLAVAWDGATWTAIANPPWSADAEVFGVESDSLSKVPTFFYGEPITHPNGDRSCRVARLGTSYTAAIPCFSSFGVARRRTGIAVVNAKNHYLLAPDEQYGGALVFDLQADTVSSLCGPVLSFASGSANTRAGGLYGLLSTIVGSGGNQLALSSVGGSTNSMTEFGELSVAADGTAWARIEDSTACGTITDRLVRFEKEEWQPVAAPQGAASGRSLAAVSSERAYTIDIASDKLLIAAAGGWTEGPELEQPWSLFAVKTDDVWVGGMKENFGHYDGKTYTPTKPTNRFRQAEQIIAVGNDVWMVQQGTTQGNTDLHVVHWNGTDLTDENMGIQYAGANIRVSAVPNDPSHVYRSGHPAAAWDGTKWNDLSFDANDVWARSPEEIYFTDRGDIWKWDGAKRARVFHGFIPVTAISGSKDRAFAVGPGGLTLEFAAWPDEQR